MLFNCIFIGPKIWPNIFLFYLFIFIYTGFELFPLLCSDTPLIDVTPCVCPLSICYRLHMYVSNWRSCSPCDHSLRHHITRFTSAIIGLLFQFSKLQYFGLHLGKQYILYTFAVVEWCVLWLYQLNPFLHF